MIPERLQQQCKQLEIASSNLVPEDLKTSCFPKNASLEQLIFNLWATAQYMQMNNLQKPERSIIINYKHLKNVKNAVTQF